MATLDNRGPVLTPPAVLTYAATLTFDAAIANAWKCTLTGNPTLGVPANGVDGFMMIVSLLAQTSTRTVTVAAGIQSTQGVPTTVAIPSGKVCYFGLRYSALSGNWTLLAAQLEV